VERLDRFVSLAGRHSDLLAAATSLPSQALADKTARSEKALRAAALALLLDPADWREAGALAGKHLADTIVRVAMAGSGTAVQLAGDRDAVRGFQAHRALRLALGRHALWLAGDPAGARIDWTGQDLRRHRLAGEDLRGAIMGRADLQGMDLTGTRFDGAFLESAVLRGARIDRAVFSGARMAAADMRAIRGAAPVLSGAHLNCAQMQECVLEGASFGRANVSGASIARGALADADFTDADGLASLVTDGARLARAVGVAPATLQPAAQLT
jgi:hypothetical protein